jgi:hypothetical protein
MFTASGYADQRHELAVPDVDCRVARGQLRCGSAARHNLLVQLSLLNAIPGTAARVVVIGQNRPRAAEGRGPPHFVAGSGRRPPHHKRTPAPQQMASSLDHLVGATEQSGK